MTGGTHGAPNRREPGADRLEVGVVGAGPRGLSVVERLCANERVRPSRAHVTIHLIDPHPAGAGAVWRTDQSRVLLMNTVASQVTVHTDESVNIDGPIEPGPTLAEWAREVALFGGHDEQTVAEARRLGPDSYPTRAFYGHYLKACLDRITEKAPAHVEIRVHRSKAVAMADTRGFPDGPQGLRLENGVRLDHLDAIVLALGHLPARVGPGEARTASLARIHHLTYLTPANPADVDTTRVPAGAPVLLRGLGLNFFDHMALFTEGRGGAYHERDGHLVYVPSGDEPVLYAFSRRGVPYHARGENQKGASGRYLPRLLTVARVERMRAKAAGGLGLRRDLWPFIAREVESVYYGTLLRSQGRADEEEEFVSRYLTAGEPDALLRAYRIDPRDHWDWDRVARPCAGRDFDDRTAFRTWLLEHLREDIRMARRGNVEDPTKAALDVLRDLRNEVRLAVDHGGLEGISHRDELDGWYTPLNAYLSIGPPVSRVRELVALIEAGVVEILGPGTQVRLDTEAPDFVAHSTRVPGTPVRSKVLIEARLPEPDLRRTADPLLRHLLDSDQISAHRIAVNGGPPLETGGLAVTGRPYRTIDGRGRAHPRRFAYGVPTEAVHWVTAAGTRPGVDSVTLGDSDAIARAVLDLAPAATARAGTADHLTGVIV
ncbi:FAD/NAD(P)-binding protein [Nocardiopsis lambiniae]|uniref:FAD/NAD(P)-binding protein n=1 Tax=Nocardiopsis lambiniae TaxID=3075539 RepID=A0ABU2MA11_9ACTN|nr:FAD/NAD(P)-binding protein [Nocardiopsis sp. DSM 44743]MDT0329506.1 FAD/NAD(P)-binding protein [Nocardiopsis sp. DSM 44743]